MRIIIQVDQFVDKGHGPERHGVTVWDTIEWDDKTVMTHGDARGLLTRMVAQSIQEWAEKQLMEDKLALSRKQREAAKEEVETELQRQREEGPGDGTL